MGKLILSKSLLIECPILVNQCFQYLERECRATLIESYKNHCGDFVYIIEGEDIPIGYKNFCLIAERLTEHAFILVIE